MPYAFPRSFFIRDVTFFDFFDLRMYLYVTWEIGVGVFSNMFAVRLFVLVKVLILCYSFEKFGCEVLKENIKGLFLYCLVKTRVMDAKSTVCAFH